MHTLSVSDLRKQYKRNKPVLNGASFEARSGECIGIVGANGSGKSTLLSMVAGVLRCDGGLIRYDEKPLAKNDFASTIAYVPQENPLIEELSVRDNLRLWYGKDLSVMEDDRDPSLTNNLIGILGIQDFIDRKVGQLSGGMKKRLSIAIAVANRQPVLLLDEPGAALDLPCKERIGVYLNNQKKQGRILIITTHEEREIELCDRLLLLQNGVLHPIEYDGNIHKLVGLLNVG